MYNTIGLDIDKYQLKIFYENIYNVWNTINTINKHFGISSFKIFSSKKGLNIIFKTYKELSVGEMFYFRLLMFDDLFRLRADVSKYYKAQFHRINRIWEEKDGYKKEVVFNGHNMSFYKLKEITETKIKELFKKKESE